MKRKTIPNTTIHYTSDEIYEEYVARTDEQLNEELDFVIEFLQEHMTAKDFAVVDDELFGIAIDFHRAIYDQTELNPESNADELEDFLDIVGECFGSAMIAYVVMVSEAYKALAQVYANPSIADVIEMIPIENIVSWLFSDNEA